MSNCSKSLSKVTKSETFLPNQEEKEVNQKAKPPIKQRYRMQMLQSNELTVTSDWIGKSRGERPDCVPELWGSEEGLDGFIGWA